MKKQLLLLATLCCWFTLPALCGNGINMHSGVVYTCLANLYDQGDLQIIMQITCRILLSYIRLRIYPMQKFVLHSISLM